MSIYIGGPVEVSDMQGPCPDGFHIPLTAEWQGLKTIMDGLGLTTGDSWRINLHMPFAGCRLIDTANLANQGTRGHYWSSSPYGSAAPTNARNLYLYSSVLANDNSQRTQGNSVRCFKDSFELPTSSWAVIAGTLGSAGIFWNQTEGLISITSDGTTGYTIQDKNLGATTVYNDGDALTQDNMGNMYQWGNNYGFPSTGSVSKTSSAQVNAQNYGPGNYYESDTFIIRSSNPFGWDSSNNDNLRGGVSQGTSTKSVEVQNIYIGEYLNLQLVFDFSVDISFGDYTYGYTSGGGLTIETANGWVTDGGSSYGNGSVYKTIPGGAKKVWTRVLFNFLDTSTSSTRGGGICLYPFDSSLAYGSSITVQTAKELSIFDADVQKNLVNPVFSLGTDYYLDFKFDNGVFDAILTDMNNNVVSSTTYTNTSVTSIPTVGFSMWNHANTPKFCRIKKFWAAYKS